MMARKKRYAIVGTGGRASMYIDPLATRFRDSGELVALCDVSPTRLEYHKNRLMHQFEYPEVPTFHADDFDGMIEKTKPDIVIVTTVDALHHKYVIRAMELGCDAITEKPMTIDAEKCRAILDTVHQTGKTLRVAFNYRWGPGATAVRKVIGEGVIGDIIHVDLEYMLNTSHGADYFRRWHREKDKSGGLIVHKATHHFDLVNWWIDAVPDTVFGMGRLAYYGRDNAERRGVSVNYDRYTGNDTSGDPFAIDLSADDTLRSLYLDAEKDDGYIRDRNVFGDDITIEDTMSLLVRYRTGVVLNYSLNAYLPREGFQVAFNGTEGRIEYEEIHSSNIVSGRAKQAGSEAGVGSRLVVYPAFGDAYEVDIHEAEGGHGGGDPLLQAQIFSRDAPPDPLGRDARQGQGAASALIGIAANRSFETGGPVRIGELCPELGDATRFSELP
jgi:predicted dehydrogenase